MPIFHLKNRKPSADNSAILFNEACPAGNKPATGAVTEDGSKSCLITDLQQEIANRQQGKPLGILLGKPSALTLERNVSAIFKVSVPNHGTGATSPNPTVPSSSSIRNTKPSRTCHWPIAVCSGSLNRRAYGRNSKRKLNQSPWFDSLIHMAS